MKFKRIASLVLALTIIGSSLVACGGKAGSPENTGTSAPTNSPANSAASSQAPEKKPVELIWHVAGGGPQADTPAVLAELNKYLKDKINASVNIVETDFGSYDQKMQLVIASQEKFDICFTTGKWVNSYYSNISKNAYRELNDLLDTYAPELKAAIPEGGWNAAKVNGNIYGVPNMQIWALTNGLIFVKEFVDKYNFDVNSVKTLKDVEPLLAAFKKDNPSLFPMVNSKGGIMSNLTANFGYDQLIGENIPGVVMLDGADLKVINQYELPQLVEHFKMMYDWNKKGYFRPDALTVENNRPEQKAGKVILSFSGNVKPGEEVNEKETYGGRDVVIKPVSDSWLTTNAITATLNSISRTSENPERAMEFLNLVNTDKTVYNLITIGIEGKHYNKIDEKYVKPIENSGYNPNADWMYGNQFMALLKEGMAPDVWEKTIAINNSAKSSAANGFSFDPSKVTSELASVSAVVKEYQPALDTGSIDPEKALPEFLQKLEQAGSKTVMAELQRQLDAWKAAK